MVKYHMSTRNGQPAMLPCHATVRACPVSGPEGHRDFADAQSAELYNTAMEFERDNNFKMGDLMERAADGQPITEKDMEKALRKNRRFMRSNQDPNDPKYQRFLLENGNVDDIRQVLEAGRELDAQELNDVASRFRNMPDSPEKGRLGLELMDKTYAVDEFANARDYAFHEGVVNGNWRNVGQVFSGTIRNERDRRLMHQSREALAEAVKGSLTEEQIARHQASMEQMMQSRQDGHKREISERADRFRSPKSMWKRRMADPNLTAEQRRDLDAAYMRIKDMDHSSVMELNHAMDTLYGQGVRPERTFATKKLLDRAVIHPARTARSAARPIDQNGEAVPAFVHGRTQPRPRRAQSTTGRSTAMPMPSQTPPAPGGSTAMPVPPAPSRTSMPTPPPAPPAGRRAAGSTPPAPPAGGRRSTSTATPPAPPSNSYDPSKLGRAIPQAQSYVGRADSERQAAADRLKAAQEKQSRNEEALNKAKAAQSASYESFRQAHREEMRLSKDLFGDSYNMDPSSVDSNRERVRRARAAVFHPVKYARWRNASARRVESMQRYNEAKSEFNASYRVQGDLKSEVDKAGQAYQDSQNRLDRAIDMLDKMRIGDPVVIGPVGGQGAVTMTYDTNKIMDMFENLFR